MKTFKEWWNSPAHNGSFTPRQVAEAAWHKSRLIGFDEGFGHAKAMYAKTGSAAHVVVELEEKLEIADKDIRYLKKRLGDANEQITSIAKDNGKLRTELASYQEPTEERAVKYIATVNEVCEDEADAFYMGTLDDIMEWCEDWNHCINDVKFYRLGDEVRVSFVDMGKETRFGVGSE